MPAPVNDPGLVTIRWQLVRCRPGQQYWLANLHCGHSFACGTEQIGQYRICIHEGLPFARILAGETGVGLHRPGRCDFRHTQWAIRVKTSQIQGLAGIKPRDPHVYRVWFCQTRSGSTAAGCRRSKAGVGPPREEVRRQANASPEAVVWPRCVPGDQRAGRLPRLNQHWRAMQANVLPSSTPPTLNAKSCKEA